MKTFGVPVSPEEAGGTGRTISQVLNEAVRLALAEEAEDLEAFQSRAQEPNLDFDNVLRSPRQRGKL